jgi:signal transduction histidine kinase
MRFFYKEKKVRNGYIAAFGLVMISYMLLFMAMQQMDKRAGMVNHTNEVINNLDILLSCLKDAESTFRGFAITHDTTMLDAYRYQLNCTASGFDQVKKLTHRDSTQSKLIEKLFEEVEEKKHLLSRTINDIINDSGPAHQTLANRINRGSIVMDSIRTMVFKIQTNESERLIKRTMAFESMTKTLKMLHLITFILALLLVIYSVIVFNNVSKAKMKYRVQLEEGIVKLEEANEDLINLRSAEKFAASSRIARAIAHEVRNPLTSITLASEQLASSIKTPDEAMLLEMVTRNTKRINDLVSALFNSTKFSQLNLSRISLHTVIDQALELASDRIELNKIRVIKNTSPNHCIVEADKEKLSTAFLNLIINAIEAMEPGNGVLEITTIRKDDKCLAIIKDNGTGMNENALSRIFEPYFTEKEKGNGLGLTLTQNIVLNHKGNIIVDSKIQKGTTFTVVLNNVE